MLGSGTSYFKHLWDFELPWYMNPMSDAAHLTFCCWSGRDTHNIQWNINIMIIFLLKKGANKNFYSHTCTVKIVKVAWMLQDGCIFGNYTILFDARFQVCNSGVVHVFSGSPAKYKNSNVILLMTSILCGWASQNIPTTMYFGACNLIPHFHGLQFCSPALIVLLIGNEIWLPIPMTAQSTM